jgi:hypothetical protein
LSPAPSAFRHAQVEQRVAVAGDHDVDRRAHLGRLVDDLAARLAAVGGIAAGAGVGEHDDRLDAALAQLRHPAVDGVRDVGEAEPLGVARQQEVRCRGRGDADEADAHAGPLDDRVRRQQRLAVAIDRVGGDVGKPGSGVAGRGAVDQPPVGVALQGGRSRAAAAAQQPQQLVAALVELVVADRADVEAEPVGDLDRRLVVEPARDQRRRADHVAGVDADRPAGQRRGVEMGVEPGRAADAGTRRLEVAVEVVDAKQPELHDSRALALRAVPRRRVGAGGEADQRHEDRRREGGESGG